MGKIIAALVVGVVGGIAVKAWLESDKTNCRAYRAKDGRLYDHKETPEEYNERHMRKTLGLLAPPGQM